MFFPENNILIKGLEFEFEKFAVLASMGSTNEFAPVVIRKQIYLSVLDNLITQT